MPVEELYRTGTGAKELIVALATTYYKRKLGMIKLRYKPRGYKRVLSQTVWIRTEEEALRLAEAIRKMAYGLRKQQSQQR